MFSRRQFSALLLTALAALPAAALAQPHYTVTVVGVAGSEATGINSSGAVVGNFTVAVGITRGFVNVAGVITDLGTLGGPHSTASGINDSGAIVGTSHNAGGNERAYLYTGGAMTDLGTLGGAESSAAAINNRGDIVGMAQIAGGGFGDRRAFLLRSGAGMQDLGRFDVPDTEGISRAMGLNEARKVVGASALGPFMPPESPFHAFLYSCEEMHNLGTLGGQFSMAYAINAKGQVVGEASTPELHENRAFLWYKGILHNLGAMPDGEFSSARAINNHGQVVGVANGTTAGVQWRRAFLYQGGNMRALDTLIPPASGWMIQGARGINDSGQIAATGCMAGVCRALRLDPVP